jgi:Tfp pilus assembly protein PilV
MRARDNRGFMLLDVILAGAILAVALFALINALSRCLAATHAVKNHAIADSLLQKKSWEIRAETQTPQQQLATTDVQEGDFGDEFPGFYWRATIEPGPTNTLFVQTITVRWLERGDWVEESLAEYRYLPHRP